MEPWNLASVPIDSRRMKDLPRVGFHDLRHSHATQLLASGIQYSHVTHTMQSDAAMRLDSAMQAAKGRLKGRS